MEIHMLVISRIKATGDQGPNPDCNDEPDPCLTRNATYI